MPEHIISHESYQTVTARPAPRGRKKGANAKYKDLQLDHAKALRRKVYAYILALRLCALSGAGVIL